MDFHLNSPPFFVGALLDFSCHVHSLSQSFAGGPWRIDWLEAARRQAGEGGAMRREALQKVKGAWEERDGWF